MFLLPLLILLEGRWIKGRFYDGVMHGSSHHPVFMWSKSKHFISRSHGISFYSTVHLNITQRERESNEFCTALCLPKSVACSLVSGYISLPFLLFFNLPHRPYFTFHPLLFYCFPFACLSLYFPLCYLLLRPIKFQNLGPDRTRTNKNTLVWNLGPIRTGRTCGPWIPDRKGSLTKTKGHMSLKF